MRKICLSVIILIKDKIIQKTTLMTNLEMRVNEIIKNNNIQV